MEKLTLAIFGFLFFGISNAQQTAEWRLKQAYYNTTDPDGVGPAVGSVSFTLEMRAVNGAPFTASDITVGYSWQSTKAMIPTTSACTGNPPPNITISPEFTAATFTYTTVNLCNVLAVTAGGQLFDRTAVGTLSPTTGGINLTTAWTPAFTVTLWSLSPLAPEAGYVMVHSGDGGSPGPLSSYAMAITSGSGEAIVNSQTYATPLALGSATLPVTFGNINAECLSRGVKLNWNTLAELNTTAFEIEKSKNGSVWSAIGSVKAAGYSSASKSYQFIDGESGTAIYRLKIVDKDGKFTYSGAVSINCQTRTPQLFVYPVPAKNDLNVVLPSDKAENVTFQVSDLLGRIHQQQVIGVQKGSNNIRLNVRSLNSGEYFLRIIQGDKVTTQKIMIANQ